MAMLNTEPCDCDDGCQKVLEVMRTQLAASRALLALPKASHHEPLAAVRAIIEAAKGALVKSPGLKGSS